MLFIRLNWLPNVREYSRLANGTNLYRQVSFFPISHRIIWIEEKRAHSMKQHVQFSQSKSISFYESDIRKLTEREIEL